MSVKGIFFFGCIVCCLVGAFLATAENIELMSVDDIHAGMKGVGKTVFSGTTIEEFDVEILGVLKNSTPRGDVIMAKLSGGPLPLEKFGIIAGMSGSPVYIDGKLIGAVAFGPIFPKEPMIAGITPIHEMISEAAHPAPEIKMASAPAKVARMASAKPQGANLAGPSGSNLVPLQTPLFISGVDQQVLSMLQNQFAAFGMFPMQGGSVSKQLAQKESAELKPGSAMGIQLIRGDMDACAVGTLTYRDNDNVIAFGHPMFSAGNVNFPLVSAYVHFVMSNQISPFKVSSPLATIGAITQDRRTGVSGALGLSSPMIPLKVTVASDREPNAVKSYAFEVIDHPLFLTLLMNAAGMEALVATENALGDATIQISTRIALKDHAPLTVEETFTGNQNLVAGVAEAFTPLNALMANNFAPVNVEEVSLAINVTHVIQYAEITGVHIPDNVVRPGETIEATVSLTPYGKEPTTVTGQITIPEDLQQEKVQLVVCDATANNTIETARAAAKFQPQSLDQLIKLLGEHVSQNRIILSLFQLRPGVVMQGQELPAPPISMMTLVGNTRRSSGQDNLTRGRILRREEISTPYIVSGVLALELTIDHSARPQVDPTDLDVNGNDNDAPQL
jgi:hypothetical protein